LWLFAAINLYVGRATPVLRASNIAIGKLHRWSATLALARVADLDRGASYFFAYGCAAQGAPLTGGDSRRSLPARNLLMRFPTLSAQHSSNRWRIQPQAKALILSRQSPRPWRHQRFGLGSSMLRAALAGLLNRTRGSLAWGWILAGLSVAVVFVVIMGQG